VWGLALIASREGIGEPGKVTLGLREELAWIAE
jgi:hypothetical protein